MRKAVCALLIMALMLGLFPAQAELAWGEWSELEPGLWQRAGQNPDEPEMIYQQLGEGKTAAELTITQQYSKSFGENRIPVWSMRDYFNADGQKTAYENYNYDEKGTLSHGAFTLLDGEGKIKEVFSMIVKPSGDGGFETQIEIFNDKNEQIGLIMMLYDKEGWLISASQLNPDSGNWDLPADPPERDPIRDEWLRDKGM